MTLAQKLQLVDGTGFSFNAGYAGHIAGIPALGIPDLYLADGAIGVGTGLASLTAGAATPFELDATGLSASGGGGFFGHRSW
jgi:hypothetical protein